MSEQEETITLDQLEEGLRDIGYIGGQRVNSQARYTFSIADPRGVAEAIFRRFREPEYEQGQVYMDANGNLFCRYGAGWRDCRTGVVHLDFTAKRPLRKLVPEDG